MSAKKVTTARQTDHPNRGHDCKAVTSPSRPRGPYPVRNLPSKTSRHQAVTTAARVTEIWQATLLYITSLFIFYFFPSSSAYCTPLLLLYKFVCGQEFTVMAANSALGCNRRRGATVSALVTRGESSPGCVLVCTFLGLCDMPFCFTAPVQAVTEKSYGCE